MKTEQDAQETFWTGEFGDAYVERNTIERFIPSYTAMWSKILSHCRNLPESAFEIGCNVGLNLQILRYFSKKMKLFGVEINQKAYTIASKNIDCEVKNCSIFDYNNERTFDLVFTCGVLIHINPEKLNNVYEKIYKLANKYILLSEYYNPYPLEVSYRGYHGKLFKRDFAGDMLDRFAGLSLTAYGFHYHKDPVFPIGDSTWFLLEKN